MQVSNNFLNQTRVLLRYLLMKTFCQQATMYPSFQEPTPKKIKSPIVSFQICMMFSLVDHSLKIRGIQVSDGGDYTCYISTNGPPVSVTHNLQILGKYEFRTYATKRFT